MFWSSLFLEGNCTIGCIFEGGEPLVDAPQHAHSCGMNKEWALSPSGKWTLCYTLTPQRVNYYGISALPPGRFPWCCFSLNIYVYMCLASREFIRKVEVVRLHGFGAITAAVEQYASILETSLITAIWAFRTFILFWTPKSMQLTLIRFVLRAFGM